MPLIRDERPQDADTVHGLLAAAFGREAETRLVERLRASGKIFSSLVAEEKARVLGHVVLSWIAVGEAGNDVPVLALAPLAVMPAFQRLGIGSALVSAALERARQEHNACVLVLGDPQYYPRFGFVAASRYGLKCPFPALDEAFMAVGASPAVFSKTSGMARYGHEFDDLE